MAILSHTVVSGKAIPLGRAHPGSWEPAPPSQKGLAACSQEAPAYKHGPVTGTSGGRLVFIRHSDFTDPP